MERTTAQFRWPSQPTLLVQMIIAIIHLVTILVLIVPAGMVWLWEKWLKARFRWATPAKKAELGKPTRIDPLMEDQINFLGRLGAIGLLLVLLVEILPMVGDQVTDLLALMVKLSMGMY